MKTQASPIGKMVHNFESYPVNQQSRSVFPRNNKNTLTMNSGYLVPIWRDFAYPGDTLVLSCISFARLATQIVPFMDNVKMAVHFWKVPVRLLWDNWTKFMGEQENPGDSTDYLTPQITTPAGGAPVNSIYDYFGIPIGVPNLSFNAFDLRAYNFVYNEDYRDENLINRVPFEKGDTDSYDNYKLLKRGKRKDYFTGALPWPQKGPAVDLPLGVSAPVYGNGSSLYMSPVSNPTNILTSGISPDSKFLFRGSNIPGTNTDVIVPEGQSTPFVVDLSEATSATINSLRQAFALQRFYEKDARGGTRYTEKILSHFGIQSPDGRLQRPEFIGGGVFDLQLSVVPQMSSTNNESPQGNLASFGIINGHTKKIVTSFTEHCVVFGVACIYADYTYQQGLERDWSRRSQTDYYFPTFAHLGEQAVLNKEIYAQGADVKDSNNEVVDDQVFGYQERWAEMRYKQNRICGQLRSTAPQSLDYWHLGQDFSSLPKLNEEFINENPPIDRVIAVIGDNTPQFISQFYFNETWIRPMPIYSYPGGKM